MNPLALERAEKGLAWLKESGLVYGLDVNAVEIERLDLACDCDCVLGQLSIEYDYAMLKLRQAGAVPDSKSDASNWAMEHGFFSNVCEGVFFEDLTEAWKQLLRFDRAQASDD